MVKNVKRYLKEQAKDDRNPPIRGEGIRPVQPTIGKGDGGDATVL